MRGVSRLTHPVTSDRFEDFADVINPNRRATHCWCLSHRLAGDDIEDLGEREPRAGDARPVRADAPPGSRHLPRRRPGRLVQHRSTLGDPTAGQLLPDPASRRPARVEHRVRRRARRLPQAGCHRPAARGRRRVRQGARRPRCRGVPVDPPGRMDTTMAFVGTRSMFQKAGFRVIGTTDAVASKMPRLIMRRDLSEADRFRRHRSPCPARSPRRRGHGAPTVHVRPFRGAVTRLASDRANRQPDDVGLPVGRICGPPVT